MKYFHSEHYPIEFVVSENMEKDFSSHNHTNHYVISLCVKGSIHIKLEDKSLVVHENRLFVVPPFMPHAVTLTNTSILVSLCIDKSFLQDYNLTKATEIVETILLTPEVSKHLTKVQAELILQTFPYVHESQPYPYEKLESDIISLCDTLMDSADTLALDQLAKDLYISKYYLIKKCKRNLGLTPHNLHIQYRIRRAQKLLLTDKSIAEVSMYMGFYDQSHFNKYFRKIVGVSPTEYIASSKII